MTRHNPYFKPEPHKQLSIQLPIPIHAEMKYAAVVEGLPTATFIAACAQDGFRTRLASEEYARKKEEFERAREGVVGAEMGEGESAVARALARRQERYAAGSSLPDFIHEDIPPLNTNPDL